MERLSLLLFLFITFGSTSCKKEDKAHCNVNDGPAEMIVGTWELESTFNPWTNETTDPDDEGYSVVISYLSDGTFIHDDSRETGVETGTYQVITDRTVSCTANECIYLFDQGTSYTITCDQLIYDSTPVDGPRNVYTRFEE